MTYSYFQYELFFNELPFEMDEHYIIYIEDEYDEDVNQYIQSHYTQIQQHFKERGFEFCYFPRLQEEVLSEVFLKYYRPSGNFIPKRISLSSSFMIDFLSDDNFSSHVPPSLLYCTYPLVDMGGPDNSTYGFRAIELSPESKYYLTPDLSEILDAIVDEIDNWEDYEGGIGLDDDWSFYDDEDDENSEENLLIRKDLEEKLDVLNRLEGRSIYRFVLEKQVPKETKLSKLTITKDHKIILSDYNNGINIHIPPLQKVFFLFYLNHPEGIRYCNLIDYKEELVDWYKILKPTFDNSYIKKIENIIKITDNDYIISQQISKIKKSFLSNIDDYLAKNYYVVGEKGEEKKILLPRELVHWECRRVNPMNPA